MSTESRVTELWNELYCEGGIPLVREIIELDPQQARNSSYVFTLLHIVASEGDTDLAMRLLSLGADVNATDWRDQTPLHEAAAQCHPSMCQLLIQAGANQYAKDRFDRTPLDDAITGDPWADPEVKNQTITLLQAAQEKSPEA